MKQRVGGFLKPALFEVEQFSDDKTAVALSGSKYAAVNCLLKLTLGNKEQEVLTNSQNAATRAAERGDISTANTLVELLNSVDGLTDNSLNAVSKLIVLSDLYETCPDIHITYHGNSWLEATTLSGNFTVDEDGIRTKSERSVRAEIPEFGEKTSMRVLVERCLSFYEGHSPILKAGFSFGDGYFGGLTRGEGDILTKDAIWTIETFKQKLTSRHTFRLLLNWMLACHSSDEDLCEVSELGVFNPVTNVSYVMRGSDVPLDVISYVQDMVFDLRE